MDPRDFHQLALRLAQSIDAAELRTAISRSYYATYHVGVALLETMGFRLSRGPAGHGEVRNRLSNSGDPEVMRVGHQLGSLQSQRIAADYRLDHTNIENPKTAQAIVQQARRMIQILDVCFAEPKRSHIRRAIQAWERSIAGTRR
jgi:uncharacterized protein (UPF0332 family)